MRNVSPQFAIGLIVLWAVACGQQRQSEQVGPNENRPGPENSPDAGGGDAGADRVPDARADGGTPDGGVYGSVAVLHVTENPYVHGNPTSQRIEEPALVCCTSTTDINCTTTRDAGVFVPSRRWAVLERGRAPISVDIFTDDNCHNYVGSLSGVFTFFESNLWTSDVDFDPPLRPGTHLSLKWTAGDCETTCVPYVLGSSPDGCWADYE